MPFPFVRPAGAVCSSDFAGDLKQPLFPIDRGVLYSAASELRVGLAFAEKGARRALGRHGVKTAGAKHGRMGSPAVDQQLINGLRFRCIED